MTAHFSFSPFREERSASSQRFAGGFGSRDEDHVAENAELADAQELARVGSWTCDLVTGERSFSNVLCELFGIDPASHPRMEDFLDRMAPDDCARMRTLQERALEAAEPVTAELRVPVNGELRWFRTRVRCIRAGDGSPLKEIGVVFDITETKLLERERCKLEAKLEQASRLSTLGRLAATVAHEFNNVLMGIAPSLDILRRTDSRERMAAALDRIGASVSRGRRISDDILRFTRPAEPVRTTFAIAPWLQKIVSEATSMLPAHCIVQLAAVDESLVVEADANQLHQIFANLVLNARDAMPGGGVLTLSANRDAAGTRYRFAVLDAPERYVHFTVTDSGTGMDAETLRQIFEPLFTTKRNGTGLGLAVTHQLIRAHGGEIFAESTPGAGTSFHFFLPLAARSS